MTEDVLGFIAFHTCEQCVCVRAAVAAGIRIIYKFFLFRSAFDIELYSWPAQSDSHVSDDNFLVSQLSHSIGDTG